MCMTYGHFQKAAVDHISTSGFSNRTFTYECYRNVYLTKVTGYQGYRPHVFGRWPTEFPNQQHPLNSDHSERWTKNIQSVKHSDCWSSTWMTLQCIISKHSTSRANRRQLDNEETSILQSNGEDCSEVVGEVWPGSNDMVRRDVCGHASGGVEDVSVSCVFKAPHGRISEDRCKTRLQALTVNTLTTDTRHTVTRQEWQTLNTRCPMWSMKDTDSTYFTTWTSQWAVDMLVLDPSAEFFIQFRLAK